MINNNNNNNNEDLRRLAVNCTPVKDYQLTVVKKNLREVKYTANCVGNWNLIKQTNGKYTILDLSREMRRTKISGILR